jgi:hypothetical protein
MTTERKRRFEQVYAEHRTAVLGYVLRRRGPPGASDRRGRRRHGE